MFSFLVPAPSSPVRYFYLAVLCVIALTLVGPLAQAQDDVITTDTALVQLNVGVVDKQGHSIINLSKSDFVVYEDGVRRPILSFEPTQAPFSLVMLLDMSGSTVTFRQQIRAAALRFLDALTPEDRVSVVEFNGKGVKSLVGFTTDRRRAACDRGSAALRDAADRRGDRAAPTAGSARAPGSAIDRWAAVAR